MLQAQPHWHCGPGMLPTTLPASDPKSDASAAVPLAVWPCAQTSAQYQRTGRYLPSSRTHPGKMLPELARRLVAEYCPPPPGGLVADPMCGIGTTLVEAATLGRSAVGVELEPRWAELARANLTEALPSEQAGLAEVRQGDARQMPELLADVAGRVDLVVTSPPYACDAGMIDKPTWRAGGPAGRCAPATLSTTPAIRLTWARPASRTGSRPWSRSWPAAPACCARGGCW